MTVLYLAVCRLPVMVVMPCWLDSILGALSWNIICCVCLEGSGCACTNKLSLTISLNTVGVFSHTRCFCFFWPAAYRRCSDDLIDRCGESSSPMPAIPHQWTAAPYRGEFDSLPASWFTHDCPRCESVWIVLTEADQWPDLSGFIIFVVRNWTSVLVFAMLWGEPGTCDTSVILTLLKYVASYHHHTVACHVSRVQKDPNIPHCHLFGYQHFRRSGRCDGNNVCFRG
jgi:hypothetical protein